MKEHKNGPGTLGHWTGFAVTVPDGVDTITTVKYAFVNTAEELPETLSKSTNVEFVDAAGTKKGIAFYADITKDGVKVEHRYAAIQFCDAQGNAITPVYKFDMDFTGSSFAGQDATVTSTQYTVDSEAATIVGGTAAIETTTTVSAFLANVTKTDTDAKYIVVAKETPDITDAITFDTTEQSGKKDDGATMADGDKLVVMSEDRSVIKTYTITVTEPSLP